VVLVSVICAASPLLWHAPTGSVRLKLPQAAARRSRPAAAAGKAGATCSAVQDGCELPPVLLLDLKDIGRQRITIDNSPPPLAAKEPVTMLDVRTERSLQDDSRARGAILCRQARW
jgi:hypothetical protein